MNGTAPTFKGDSTASVVNLGTIGSTGGDVYLIARSSAVNAGTIRAPQGVAGLATGASFLLGDASIGQGIFVQTGSGGSVVNLGDIRAAQASLQAADDTVFALAANHASIRATGTAKRDGHVWLVTDSGNVSLQSTIEATNADGSGGTVDVGARTPSLGNAVGGGALVTAKQWNITTLAFTLDSTAAGAFEHSLTAGTSIGLTTTGAQKRERRYRSDVEPAVDRCGVADDERLSISAPRRRHNGRKQRHGHTDVARRRQCARQRRQRDQPRHDRLVEKPRDRRDLP